MKIDNYKTIVREQYEPGNPGDLGDACADTARVRVLVDVFTLDLKTFRTARGYIRHPDVPEDWKEHDFTSDQATPLLMGYDMTNDRDILDEVPDTYAGEMRSRLQNYHTGNGDVVSPGLWALINKDFHMLGFITVIQALLFLWPWRYSDAENEKKFVRGENEGDYLNWIVTLDYLARFAGVEWPSKICYRLHSPKKCMGKVETYYAPQPKSSWVVDVYKIALARALGRIT